MSVKVVVSSTGLPAKSLRSNAFNRYLNYRIVTALFIVVPSALLLGASRLR